MIDAPMTTMALSVLAVIAGVLVNNTRLTAVKEVLRVGFRSDIKEVRHEMENRFNHVDDRFNKLDGKLDRIGDTLSAITADHEDRIRAIELRLRGQN